ncbi:MAG: FkbM family methyltransferase [Gemmatimonadaceae bacterium]
MKPYGSFPRDISPARDLIDFWLTRMPRLYTQVERFRHWINWDKRLYLSLINPGDVVLDIGANTGTHTVIFSHLVGKSGKVLAFEPVPASFERLQANLARRSRFANVSAFQVAIGNPASRHEGTTIIVPGEDPTQASLRVQTGGSWAAGPDFREYSCPLTSIDAEVSDAALSRLDFLKMDIEGGELDALKGAARALSTHRPFIYSEVYEKWTAGFGYTSADLFALLRSLGYDGARVFHQSGVRAIGLDDGTIAGLFEASTNVLFFSDRHRGLVESFDRRFHVGAPISRE